LPAKLVLVGVCRAGPQAAEALGGITNKDDVKTLRDKNRFLNGKVFMMNQNSPEDKVQIVYFSHGGGPLPILGDASHKAMVDFMRQLPSQSVFLKGIKGQWPDDERDD
jgi:hypothetical protein